ncbi:MAG: hypothetical protein ACRDGQ_08580 [Candidatus Limnocylindrales bacterium]
MNDRWRSIAFVLAVILAILGGIAAAVVLNSGPGPSVLPSPTTAAGASSPPSPSAGDSVASAASPSIAVAPTPSPSPTASPSPTPQANLTSITFTAMHLDAQKGTLAGLARTFAFATEGPGSVTAAMKSTTASGRTIFCLKPVGGTSVCRTGTSATLTGTTSRPTTNWLVSAIGSGTDAPTLDISLTFGTSKRSVTLTNGRFDGTDFPYDGATFEIKPRSAGSIKVSAAWGHPFDYALLVEPASTPAHDLASAGNAPSATASFAALAGTLYVGTVANLEGGFGITNLTLTVSWP